MKGYVSADRIKEILKNIYQPRLVLRERVTVKEDKGCVVPPEFTSAIIRDSLLSFSLNVKIDRDWDEALIHDKAFNERQELLKEIDQVNESSIKRSL